VSLIIAVLQRVRPVARSMAYETCRSKAVRSLSPSFRKGIVCGEGETGRPYRRLAEITGAAALAAMALALGAASPSQAQVPGGAGLPAAQSPPSIINMPLPIAPTGGLDQRLGPSLNTPQDGLITVTPAAEPTLGVLRGRAEGSEPVCTIGREGVAVGLARGSCANVVNVPRGNDLLQ